MRILLSAAALLVATGCTSLGPAAVQGTRTDYNIALRQSDDQQLLLNLVRLRYRDSALFLESSALTTQFRFGASAEASTELGQVDNLYGLRGGAIIEENPTVSYTPLQGRDFVERVLSPIRLETLLLLDTSGWSTERAFRVLVDQMNGVKNAPRANGPTPDTAPEFEDFVRASKLLRRLELDDLVFGARTEEGVVLHFDEPARSRPEYRELMDLLELDPALGQYPVSVERGYQPRQENLLRMRFRSFAGVMYFLSQSVEVPQRDVDAGRVTVTRDASGRPFDWNRVTEELMRIHSSDKRPKDAAIAVFYRGSWFYIHDSDLNSKSTFSMLGQVFALQSGNVESITPVLTLPVGG